MTRTTLDLTGLKCPMPALRTAKALKRLSPGDILEVHCTDPLAVIDVPNLIQQSGDKVEIALHAKERIIFLIEKTNSLIGKIDSSPGDDAQAWRDNSSHPFRNK